MESKFNKSYEQLRKNETGIVGYANWSQEINGSYLICFNVQEKGSVRTKIFQLWEDGNGYTVYSPDQNDTTEKRLLVISKGTYGSNQHPCLWMERFINDKPTGHPEYALLYEMDFKYFLETYIEPYLKVGYKVELTQGKKPSSEDGNGK